jgi:hypothetical protein
MRGKEMKTAIIIMAHPKFGSEEATARVFNAVALAEEAKCEGDEVEVTFIGTGTRWPAELSSLGHPANALYNRLRDTVKGASCGCAAVFGAKSSKSWPAAHQGKPRPGHPVWPASVVIWPKDGRQ